MQESILVIIMNNKMEKNMDLSSLNSIAQSMVAPNKGILAADESTPTIGKRFATIDTESTESSRQTYRNMLFTAPDISDYIRLNINETEMTNENNSDHGHTPNAKGYNTS